MKIHDVEQGSAAWYALRLGIPTASEFHKIITPITGELSRQADAYACYLIAEAVLNEPLADISHLEYVGRGKLLEPEAVQMYEVVNDVVTQKVGFITTDDGRWGASPDRLIFNPNVPTSFDGAIEVKCPAPQTHVGYMMTPGAAGDDYRPQMFGQMLVCELDWVDFFSYHPRMPPIQRRVHRDPRYIAKMTAALRQFDDKLATMQARARQEGYFDAREIVPTPIDKMAEEIGQLSHVPYWQDDL